MGYKKSFDSISVYQQLNSAARELNDPRNDGFVTWGTKQDLYQIKWHLDEILKNSPTFSPEQEWLYEQEQKRVIRYLKDE